jgi:hypothetical protein
VVHALATRSAPVRALSAREPFTNIHARCSSAGYSQRQESKPLLKTRSIFPTRSDGGLVIGRADRALLAHQWVQDGR